MKDSEIVLFLVFKFLGRGGEFLAEGAKKLASGGLNAIIAAVRTSGF